MPGLSKCSIYDSYCNFLSKIQENKASLLKEKEFFLDESKLLKEFFSDHLSVYENTELLLYLGRLDNDLCQVMRMRLLKHSPQTASGNFISDREQNHRHITIMPYQLFMSLVNELPHVFPHITKISFLHHYSPQSYDRPDPDYMNQASMEKILSRLPGLEHIVLRGCASAYPTTGGKVFYKTKVCSGTANIAAVQGDFVFQQQGTSDSYKTLVKYDGKISELFYISWNDAQSKLSKAVQKDLHRRVRAGSLPLLKLPLLQEAAEIEFFDPSKKLGFFEKKFAKTLVPRIYTLRQDSFPHNPDGPSSLAERLQQLVQRLGYTGYIKAFTGAYYVEAERVMPHRKSGQDAIAIRVPMHVPDKVRPVAPTIHVSPNPPHIQRDIQQNLRTVTRAGGTSLLLGKLDQEQLEHFLIQPSHIIETLLFKENGSPRLPLEKLCVHLDPVLRQCILQYPYNILRYFKGDVVEFEKAIEDTPERVVFLWTHLSPVSDIFQEISWGDLMQLNQSHWENFVKYYPLMHYSEQLVWRIVGGGDQAILDQLLEYMQRCYNRYPVQLFKAIPLANVISMSPELRAALLLHKERTETLSQEALILEKIKLSKESLRSYRKAHPSWVDCFDEKELINLLADKEMPVKTLLDKINIEYIVDARPILRARFS